MDMPSLATLIVGSFALIGVITNLIYNIKNDYTRRSVEIITSNRVLWMDKLRDSISDFIMIANTLTLQKTIMDGDIYFKLIKKQSMISLLLNVTGKHDKKIRILLKTLQELIRKYITEKKDYCDKKVNMFVNVLEKGLNCLELYVEIYLKCEWERVKIFTRKGERKGYNYDKIFEEYRIETKLEEKENDFIKECHLL